MTRNTKQMRAVFLAALMVLSVVAGSIAFAGSAAAVDDAESSISVSPGNIDEDSTQVHTVNVSFANYSGDTSDDVIINVPSDLTVSEYDLTAYNGTSGNSIGSASATPGNSNDITVSVTDAGATNTTLYVNGTINFTAGASSADQTENIWANITDTNNGSAEVNDTITINDVGDVSGESPEYLESVHYDDDTADSNAELELSFSETVNNVNGNATLYVDEEQVGVLGDTVGTQIVNANGRVVYELSGDVRTGDVEVYLNSNITDNDDNSLVETGNQTVDVAPVTLTDSATSSLNAYKGSKVAVVASSPGTSIEVEAGDDEDFSYFQSGSTGTASNVYVFRTENREVGQYNITFDPEGSATVKTVNVRDLGFSVSVDDLTVTNEDAIEGTVEANAGERPIQIELLDSDGDVVDDENATINTRLTGQAQVDFTFDLATIEDGDLDAGNYTVLATDNQSGVEAESSSVQVEDAGEGSANFAEGIITEQRGDVANITVTVEDADYATVTLGSDDVGFESNVTVEDVNGDGEVSFLFNTYAATGVGVSSTATLNEGGSVYDIVETEDDDNDEITNATIDNGVSSLLEAGEYDVEVRSGESASADSQNVATLVLEERNTTAINSWTAPSGASYDDLADLQDAVANNNLTQSNDIADGDVAVHQIEASGLEGVLDAQEDEDVTGAWFSPDFQSVTDLTVEQANPGANQDPYEVMLGSDNTTVWADGENDTYYVLYDTEGSSSPSVDGGNIDDGDTLNANFTVLADEDNLTVDDEDQTVEDEYDVVEAEYTVDEPVNVSASGSQTISGETTVAPGTELSLRVRSSGDTQPSFLKTSNVYVTENQTFSGTFDFSEQEAGDTFTLTVSGSPAGSDEYDGNVVESVQTDTSMTTTGPSDTTTEPSDTTTEPSDTTTEPADTTTEPSDTTTEPAGTTGGEGDSGSGTQTPGFGVVVALTALLAAALLAIRRD